VVAFDQEGRPSFNTLQNYGSAAAPVVFYVFDLLVFARRDLRGETLDARRALLKKVLLKLITPVRYFALKLPSSIDGSSLPFGMPKRTWKSSDRQHESADGETEVSFPIGARDR